MLGKPGSEERELADRLYDELQDAGLETLYDDRDAGPGEKFADAELLGCPLRVTVGRRTPGRRRGRGADPARPGVPRRCPWQGAAEAVAELWRELP